MEKLSPCAHSSWARVLQLLRPECCRPHAPQWEQPLQWEASTEARETCGELLLIHISVYRWSLDNLWGPIVSSFCYHSRLSPRRPTLSCSAMPAPLTMYVMVYVHHDLSSSFKHSVPNSLWLNPSPVSSLSSNVIYSVNPIPTTLKHSLLITPIAFSVLITLLYSFLFLLSMERIFSHTRAGVCAHRSGWVVRRAPGHIRLSGCV